MQLVDLLLASIFLNVLAPVVVVAFSAYTLYASISLAELANRRQGDLMAAAALGRRLSWKTLKSLKSAKSAKSVKSPVVATGQRLKAARTALKTNDDERY